MIVVEVGDLFGVRQGREWVLEMGGKKLGACDAQGACTASPVPQGGSGERLTTGSGGKSSVGYAGVVKMGLSKEGREVLGGINGSSSTKSASSPDRIGDCIGAGIAAGAPAGVMNANGSNGMSTSGNNDVDSCTVERPIEETLSELSMHCGVEGIAGAAQFESMRASVEGLAVDSVGSNGGAEVVDNGGSDHVSGGGDKQHGGQDQWNLISVEAGRQQQHQDQLVRDFDLHLPHAERDYRPPSLILPDVSSVESDFASQQQGGVPETNFRPPQSFLPASLVMSPHDGKLNLLDPNAREFTPSPSPCPSPSPTSLVAIVQPPPYHMDQPPHVPYAPAAVELGRVMYSGEYSAAPVMPLYGNGAPLFGPISGSPSPPWDTQNMRVGMQGAELSHHISTGSGPLAPPPLVGQHPSHVLGPYTTAPAMHSFITSGCSAPIGSPTGSLPAFAVPPPLTGREHVSRALLLSGVPPELSDYALKQELEQWGLVRALGLERRHEGLVTTHYYDLRHSKEALRDIQQQHLLQQQRMQQKFQLQMQRQRSSGHVQIDNLDLEKHDTFKDSSRDDDISPRAKGLIGGKAVWAQYTVPVGTAAGPDSHNQGTLVVFNLDVDMPLDQLRAAFEVYGKNFLRYFFLVMT